MTKQLIQQYNNRCHDRTTNAANIIKRCHDKTNDTTNIIKNVTTDIIKGTTTNTIKRYQSRIANSKRRFNKTSTNTSDKQVKMSYSKIGVVALGK